MFTLTYTNMCPVCGKIRRDHTKREKAICSARTKAKFNSPSKTKNKRIAKKHGDHLGKFLTALNIYGGE